MNSGPKKAYGELQAPGKPTATNSSTRHTVTEFLESKILELTNKRLSLLTEQDGLIRRKDYLPEEESQKQLSDLLNQVSPTEFDIQAITRPKRFLEQDLEEQLEQLPAKNTRNHPPDKAFFERAYAKLLIRRVMGSSAYKSIQYNRHDMIRGVSVMMCLARMMRSAAPKPTSACRLSGFQEQKSKQHILCRGL